MRLHKIRIIQQGGGTVTGGVSIPHEIFLRWQNITVTVRESGSELILSSGTKPGPMSNIELINISKESKFIKI